MIINAAVYARRPGHKSRYRPGDIVKTTKEAKGTLTPYGGEDIKIPAGLQGSVMDVAPFRYSEEYAPAWIYRVRLNATTSTGENRFWLRGRMLRLVERNPALKSRRPQSQQLADKRSMGEAPRLYRGK